MDDRTEIAKDVLLRLISGHMAQRDIRPISDLVSAAAAFADALLEELHKVPAPSGGPGEVPPTNPASTTAQEVVTDSYGGALPRAPEADPHGR